MEKFFEKLIEGGTDLCIKLVISIFILLIGNKIIKAIEKMLKKEKKFSKLEDPSVKSFVISFITISLKLLLFVTVLSIIGIPMTSLITILGSCAVAVGLALQGGLSNLAGGIMLLIFKPFTIGDYIEANGKEGTVKSISLFYTTIVGIDNVVIQLPNGTLSNSCITNYTACEKRMLNIVYDVSYDSNIDKVKKVLQEVIDEEDKIIKDEPIRIAVKSHNDSSIGIVFRAWTLTSNYWDVYFRIMENVKKKFDKNGIEIPYPQMDVHMKK